jgi:hypothetical protein
LTEWQSEMLYYLQKKTDMSFTEICRGAINDYLHQVLADFTYNTYGSVQSQISEADFEYSTLISMQPYSVKSLYYALRDWKTCDEDLEEMLENDAQTFKMLTWEILRLLKQKTAGTILFREIVEGLDIEYLIKIAPRLLIFLRRQSDLFKYMDLIKTDKEEPIIKNKTYYDMKWIDYGNRFKEIIDGYETSKNREAQILGSNDINNTPLRNN